MVREERLYCGEHGANVLGCHLVELPVIRSVAYIDLWLELALLQPRVHVRVTESLIEYCEIIP